MAMDPLSSPPAKKKRRRPNFSDEEVLMLVAEVVQRRTVLLGPLTHKITATTKDRLWEEVAAAVSGVGRVTRFKGEVRKKFKDFRSEVKKKAAKIRKEDNITGGSLLDISDKLRDTEEAMLSLIELEANEELSNIEDSEDSSSLGQYMVTGTSEMMESAAFKVDTNDEFEVYVKEEPAFNQVPASHLPFSAGVDTVSDAGAGPIEDPLKVEVIESYSCASPPVSSSQYTSGMDPLRPGQHQVRSVCACVGDGQVGPQSCARCGGVHLSPATMTTYKDDRKFWLEFIDIYKDNPCLWKLKHKDYLDKQKKNAAYELLVQKMKERDASANRETVTKKINNIRSAFRKECKKVEASVKSGAGKNDIYTPTLWYYESLLFLKDQELPKPSLSSVDEVAMDDNDVLHLPSPSESLRSPESFQETPSRPSSALEDQECPSSQSAALGDRHSSSPLTRRRQKHTKMSAANSVLAMIGERIAASRKEDEFDTVGRNVAAKLRKMLPNMQVIAEKLINDVLYEGQIGSLKPYTKITMTDVHDTRNHLAMPND